MIRRHLTRLCYQLRHPVRFRLIQEETAEEKCIFVHIPKCAGTSIRHSLLGRKGAHRTLEVYRTMLPRDVFERCFKFTFVRNPWDRLVSAFFFLKNGDTPSNQRWAAEHLSPYKDFDSFVRQWVTRKNIWSYIHFRPQYHFICLGNRLAIDFTGFYENLAGDFAVISKKINRPATLREDNRVGGRDKDYRQYYSDEMRDIVA